MGEDERVSDEVPVFWFEDIGLLNEPLFDSPFGRFTVRQVAILGIFALIAWIAQSFFQDLAWKVGTVLFIMFFGGCLAFSRIKTVPVERSIALAFGIGKPRLRKPKKKRKAEPKPEKEKEREEEAPPELEKAEKAEEVVKVDTKTKKVVVLPRPSRVVSVSAGLDEPVRVATLVRDRVTGEPLANKPFKVYVGGKEHSAGVTDQDGGLVTYITASRFGKVRVDIFVEGYREPVDSFLLNIKLRRF